MPEKKKSHTPGPFAKTGDDASDNPAKLKITNLAVTAPMGLLEFLLATMPGTSRTKVKSLLANQEIWVNDLNITQFDHALASGDRVAIRKDMDKEKERHLSDKAARSTTPSAKPGNKPVSKRGVPGPGSGIRILFEDNDLIVVVKPAGLLSVSTENGKEHTAYSRMTEYVKRQNGNERIFILHRLDRDTSGVMMFAKSKLVQDQLQHNWNTAITERHYIVLVEGSLDNDAGTTQSWLKENKNRVMYSSKVAGDGQLATTYWQVLRRSPAFTLLQAELQSGRKNQIRVHMHDLGHPVVGDEKYGSHQNPIQRLGLHAATLAFTHPTSGKAMRFESAVPPEFGQLMDRQSSSSNGHNQSKI